MVGCLLVGCFVVDCVAFFLVIDFGIDCLLIVLVCLRLRRFGHYVWLVGFITVDICFVALIIGFVGCFIAGNLCLWISLHTRVCLVCYLIVLLESSCYFIFGFLVIYVG